MQTPLSRCKAKFSGKLSTMIVRERSRLILARSLLEYLQMAVAIHLAMLAIKTMRNSSFAVDFVQNPVCIFFLSSSEDNYLEVVAQVFEECVGVRPDQELGLAVFVFEVD